MRPDGLDVIVIGAGQAGLATGYHLARFGLRFVILEAGDRVGGVWRRRWEGLRLFTAARYDGLPGMPFPAPPESFPSKDDVADFLETYAVRFGLPVRTGVSVEELRRADDGDRYEVIAGVLRLEAPVVVVATGAHPRGKVPAFAADLDPGIMQLHSVDYRSPAQLQPGPVLVVGASNSGAEVAVGAVREHATTLVGPDRGQMPFPIDSRRARLFDRFFWPFINHVATLDTPIGRRARPFVRDQGGPLERVRSSDLAVAGVERIVGRIDGVLDGQPRLDDGRVVEAANVVWCTGFRPDFGWISLPVLGPDGWPRQRRGVATDAAGLYFVGLPFMHSAASSLLGGVGRDADHVARQVAARLRSAATAPGAATERASPGDAAVVTER